MDNLSKDIDMCYVWFANSRYQTKGIRQKGSMRVDVSIWSKKKKKNEIDALWAQSTDSSRKFLIYSGGFADRVISWHFIYQLECSQYSTLFFSLLPSLSLSLFLSSITRFFLRYLAGSYEMEPEESDFPVFRPLVQKMTYKTIFLSLNPNLCTGIAGYMGNKTTHFFNLFDSRSNYRENKEKAIWWNESVNKLKLKISYGSWNLY